MFHWIHRLEGIRRTNDNDEDACHYEITALYHRMDDFSIALEEKLRKRKQAVKSMLRVSVNSISLDFTSKEAIEKSKLFNSQFDVCVHTAALSCPRTCQENPERARAINIPKTFLNYLNDVPMIVLSTCHVYDGFRCRSNIHTAEESKSSGRDDEDDCRLYYNEDCDQPNPVNMYGQTKLELEQYFSCGDNHNAPAILLRSSIILGPKSPICSNAHDTFLHFVQTRKQLKTSYFTNEFRNVVGVDHVCQIITHFVIKQLNQQRHRHNGLPTTEVYNMGGPISVSRFDMASAVFRYRGWFDHYKCHLLEAKRTSTTVPLDLSMDSTKLQKATGISYDAESYLIRIIQTAFSIQYDKEITMTCNKERIEY